MEKLHLATAISGLHHIAHILLHTELVHLVLVSVLQLPRRHSPSFHNYQRLNKSIAENQKPHVKLVRDDSGAVAHKILI